MPIYILGRNQEKISQKSTRRSELGTVQKDGKMEDLKDSIEKYALNNKGKPLPNTG